MPDPEIVPVILCGGAGTRLWPLSVPDKPKQFHSLVNAKTLLAEALDRAMQIQGVDAPIVICKQSHVSLAIRDLEAAGIGNAQLILEPCGRNTAPAVAAAALIAASNGDDPLFLVLAADHRIENQAEFARAVSIAAQAADQGRLVTFGIVPDRAETGYGYIRERVGHGEWHEVESFVEKPNLATARQYVESGQYLWNSGMFLFRAGQYLDELARYAPDILTAVKATLSESSEREGSIRLSDSFGHCPADSIDYAVMEKTDKAAVVPLDAGWSDVGSWDAVFDLLPKDAEGNALVGEVIAESSRRCLVHAAHRKVGIVGVEDLVVVETEDAVLVMSKSESQRLKELVSNIRKPKQ